VLAAWESASLWSLELEQPTPIFPADLARMDRSSENNRSRQPAGAPALAFNAGANQTWRQNATNIRGDDGG